MNLQARLARLEAVLRPPVRRFLRYEDLAPKVDPLSPEDRARIILWHVSFLPDEWQRAAIEAMLAVGEDSTFHELIMSFKQAEAVPEEVRWEAIGRQYKALKNDQALQDYLASWPAWW